MEPEQFAQFSDLLYPVPLSLVLILLRLLVTRSLLRPLAARLGLRTSAVKRSIGSRAGCTITEKASTRAFSWLKAPTSAFTFKTLLRHYAKQVLTTW